MFGDFILFVKKKWNQFWCIHEYIPDRIGIVTGLHFGMYCKKCGKFKD